MTATTEEVSNGASTREPLREEEEPMEVVDAAATGAPSGAADQPPPPPPEFLTDRQAKARERQARMKQLKEEQERLKQEQLREQEQKKKEKEQKKKEKKQQKESERKSPAGVPGAPGGPPAKAIDPKAALQASRVPLPSRHSYAMLGELKGLLAIPSGGIADMAKTKADHQRASKLVSGEMDKIRKERDRIKRERVKLESQGQEKAKSGPSYPMDDLLLDDLHRPLHSKNRVKITRLPQELVGDVLMVYDFLRQFSKCLQLSPIQMDQLLDALTFEGETVLLAQIHMGLLRVILTDPLFHEVLATYVPREDREEEDDDEEKDAGSAMEVDQEGEDLIVADVDTPIYDGLLTKGFEPSLVRAATWPGLVRELVPRTAAFRDAINEAGKPIDMVGPSHSYADMLRQALSNLETTEYGSLCVHDKVVLLRVLVEAAYETWHISDYIDKHLDSRNAILDAKRNEEAEERRRQREEMAERREEVVKRLKQKMEDEWKAKTGGDEGGKDGEQSKKKPKLNPTPAMINAELEALMALEVPGSDLEVRDLPDWDPLSDDEPEEAEESAEVLERLTRLERQKRKKDADRREARRRQKDKERERRQQTDMERAQAISMLDDAVKVRRDPSSLKRALQAGRNAGLEGDGWCTVDMKEAYKALLEIEQAAKRAGQEAKLARELEQYTVRTEPLGHDRDLRAYYRFDGDNRIWVEEVRHVETGELMGDVVRREVAKAREEQESIRRDKERETQEDKAVWQKLKQGFLDQGMGDEEATAAAFKAFSEQLPEEGEDPALAMALQRMARLGPQSFYSSWSAIEAFEDNLKSLLLQLDTRGTRESGLKRRIVDRYPLGEITEDDEQWDRTGSQFLYKRVRREYQNEGAKEPAMGYIVGWLSADKNDGMALWHMEHDDADEEDLEEYEVVEAMRLAQEYEAKKPPEKEKPNGQSFRRYTNVLFKDGPAGDDWLGLQGLKRDLLTAGSAMVAPLKARGSQWLQAKQAGKVAWESSVTSSEAVGELAELLVALEDVAHQTQKDSDFDEEAEALKAKQKQEAAAAKKAKEEEGEGEMNGNGGGSVTATDEENDDKMAVESEGNSTETEKDDDDETETETEDEGGERLTRAAKKRAQDAKEKATKQAANGEKKKARAPPKTLWTSLQERNRWIAKVQAQKSSGGLGLALLCLIDRLKKFDCWDATKEAATSDGGGQASAGVQGRSRKRVRG